MAPESPVFKLDEGSGIFFGDRIARGETPLAVFGDPAPQQLPSPVGYDRAVRGPFEEIPGEAEEPQQRQGRSRGEQIYLYRLTHTLPFAVLDL